MKSATRRLTVGGVLLLSAVCWHFSHNCEWCKKWGLPPSVSAAKSAQPSSFTAIPLNSNSVPITHRGSSTPSSVGASLLIKLLTVAGYVIPADLKTDLDQLTKYFGCDSWDLNVRKELVLHKVTLGAEGEPLLAMIRKIRVTWDSFKEPCLEIELDSIHVWVDFLNLQLTRTNWQKLVDEGGFPPDLTKYYSSTEKNSNGEDPTALLRFHGITLKGRGMLHVHSRPLQRKLGTISLDMQVTNDLNREIQKKSFANLQTLGGRKGCTVEEIKRIVQDYATKRLEVLVARSVAQAATQTDETMDETMDTVERLIESAGESLIDYASDVGKKTGEDLQRAVLSKMDEFGATKELKKWGSLLQDALKEIPMEPMEDKQRKPLNKRQQDRINFDKHEDL